MSYSYNPFLLWDESLSMNEPERFPVEDSVPEFFKEGRSIPVFSQTGNFPDLDSFTAGLFTPPTTVVMFDIKD